MGTFSSGRPRPESGWGGGKDGKGGEGGVYTVIFRVLLPASPLINPFYNARA